MPLPLTDPETLCEALLQDLPAETGQMARACNALVWAKQVNTPAPRLRVVVWSGGLDTSWREVAGTLTALYASMTDQSVAARLRACSPWVQARLRRMLPLAATESRLTGWRVVVLDASSLHAPGATGTDHRLQIAMDLVSLPLIAVLVSDVHTGETLQHFTLTPGDVVVADRGYAPCQGMSTALQQGAARIVRLKPFRVVLRDAAGEPVERCPVLKRQTMATRRTLPVVLHAAGGQHEVRGWVYADRLNAESLWLAGWVLVLTTRSPAGLSAQTIMALYRCRWHVDITIQCWKRGLEVDALRANATSPRAEVWRHGTWR